MFEVSLETFSGPMDLLCHLAESRQIDAAKISLHKLLLQYVSFLIDNDRVTLRELAEFFSFASRLMLTKLRALMPDVEGTDDDDAIPDEVEEDLEAALARYRPVRAGAFLLARLQALRELHFTRYDTDDGPPLFDLGDLYGLARVWWQLVDQNYELKLAALSQREAYDGISDAAPSAQLVEERMEELTRELKLKNLISLKELISKSQFSLLIVTLLALLELSRLGKIKIEQETSFGDIKFSVR